jgi:hypothetical protein
MAVDLARFAVEAFPILRDVVSELSAGYFAAQSVLFLSILCILIKKPPFFSVI